MERICSRKSSGNPSGGLAMPEDGRRGRRGGSFRARVGRRGRRRGRVYKGHGREGLGFSSKPDSVGEADSSFGAR